ncbi:uncharacterized protein K452DRAFT_306629 [Aplosporella prunicola CBS 121167]|uniref:Uncharacterized protein n=1 Tax=Aplosporella prunicola CBS 121167 TaxID=1176127 RepID=A0A6A6BL49_9PEZI|nr:uncharacterized protein K452DRAFT_306629 [Aplosporella prunicola CBS 121167]KAF2143984.1 hypothetical protein K452DRAFT_306629 [Aplosporella prunicola CBS 121167]
MPQSDPPRKPYVPPPSLTKPQDERSERRTRESKYRDLVRLAMTFIVAQVRSIMSLPNHTTKLHHRPDKNTTKHQTPHPRRTQSAPQPHDKAPALGTLRATYRNLSNHASQAHARSRVRGSAQHSIHSTAQQHSSTAQKPDKARRKEGRRKEGRKE